MDEQKRKAFDLAVHNLEQEYGVYMLSFNNKNTRDRAKEDIDLAMRFKTGVLTTPSVNRLPV